MASFYESVWASLVCSGLERWLFVLIEKKGRTRKIDLGWVGGTR